MMALKKPTNYTYLRMHGEKYNKQQKDLIELLTLLKKDVVDLALMLNTSQIYDLIEYLEEEKKDIDNPIFQEKIIFIP